MTELQALIRKTAVDTLYSSRNHGLMMDQAASAVADAVLEKIAEELDRVATFETNGPGDHPDSFTGLNRAAEVARSGRAT